MRSSFSIKAVFILLSLWTGLQSAVANDAKITIAVTEGVYGEYQKLLASRGGDPLRIDDFTGYARATISPVLIQQALALGGLDNPVTFHIYPNYKRALSQVQKGHTNILGQDTWESHAKDSVYKSPAVVQRGEFKKAVYGRSTNTQLMGAKSLDDLAGMSALTGIGWHLDVAALEDIGVASINLVPKYEQHFAMLLGGRVDFSLIEPESENLNDVLPHGLQVVPGLAVSMPESRHYIVTKNHPMGQKISDALNKGLAVLIERGVINEALIQAGFLNHFDAQD